MRRAFLNLPALRASRSVPATAPESLGSRGTVSRRQALGLAGVAAVGVSPALRAVKTTMLGAYTMERAGKSRVAFLLGGKERWVVDTRQFAGSPRLEVTERADGVRVVLHGARYPGTEL